MILDASMIKVANYVNSIKNQNNEITDKRF